MRNLVLTLAGLILGTVIVWAAQANQPVDVSWSAAGWIIIYIPTADRSVDLGTIDASLYDPVTDTWQRLSSTGHSVYVATNAKNGFVLQISGSLTTYPTGHPNPNGILGRLTLASTSLGISGALDGTISYTGSRGLTFATDIAYEFTPSLDDVPGNYSVQVT